ncbi:MAG: rhamnogalacturonan acetylesterase [Butyrivibrio sp.]|nr:rhamnogalacturonan acetylesterase [Butyrivibrio sp.]
MNNNKKTIYLVGDSTVQSYGIDREPQAGWGQLLMRQVVHNNAYTISHPQDTEFGQVVRYESENLVIDNRAMAGRSSKSYFDEGRIQEVLGLLKTGDIMLIQFAHNDANINKPERYLSCDDYKKMLLDNYIVPAREKGAIPVLLTAIAMREFDEMGKCKISFPEYRAAMIELSKKENVALIDLGLLTADFNTLVGEEGCKSIYLWLPEALFEGFKEGSTDNAHLQYNGAFAYAKLVYEELIRLNMIS